MGFLKETLLHLLMLSLAKSAESYCNNIINKKEELEKRRQNCSKMMLKYMLSLNSATELQ